MLAELDQVTPEEGPVPLTSHTYPQWGKAES